MNIEKIREYCLRKKEVTESLPFDNDTLVFKVIDKMFALISLEAEPAINLKCDPEKAVELREKYVFIKPGYHMNKTHWNTIYLNNNIRQELIEELIDHSYQLVAEKMPKSKKQLLNPINKDE